MSGDKKSLTGGPLAGCRVLELGSTAAGPFCARLLADFGAEVVKVESPDGDPIRGLGEVVDGASLYAASILRNKKNVSIDFRQEAGRELLRRMVPRFDVIVENFRPGTLEKWGLSFEELRALQPGIVLTRISGFGQSGPFSQRPGYGVIGEAMSGLREMIGDPDRPPSRVAMPLTDYITALYGAFGTVMAVMEQRRTGRGQCVDVALYEAAFSFMEASVPAYPLTGKMPTRAGSRLPFSAPNNLYATSDGRYVHITALADPVFRRLASAMERSQMATDPRYAELNSRAVNYIEVDEAVASWVAGLTLEEVEARLEAANVPASRIFTMADIFAHEHFRARDMLLDVPHSILGSVTLAGVVPKLSETPGEVRWAGRDLGDDTLDVLREELGLSADEIGTLVSRGVVRAGRGQGHADTKHEKNQPD